MMDNGLSIADALALSRSNGNGGNGDGFGGFDSWIFFLFFLLAWGNGGIWGNRGGGFGGGGSEGGGYNHYHNFCGNGWGSPFATQADVRAAVDQQTLISKLDQQTYGLADSTYALNNAITSGFASAELSRCNQQAALMAQLNNIAMSNEKCCCETQRLIERGFCDTNYNLATQSNAIQGAICSSTRDILENANNNTRAILDFLTTDKIASLQAENQKLQLAASQANQNSALLAAIDASTAEIIRRTGSECPIPAYVVPNPNCCYDYRVVANNGCGGCGSF